LKANGEDLSFVTATIVDKNGNPCPTADTRLDFKVSGKGSFRAVCNGDATSLELFNKPTMKAFSGKLVILVQSGFDTGDVKLTVVGKGLKEGKVTLQVR
jgi:beta-galactosidase